MPVLNLMVSIYGAYYLAYSISKSLVLVLRKVLIAVLYPS